jgi:hypothetical protein
MVLMRSAIEQHLKRDVGRNRLWWGAIASWAEYQATGQAGAASGRQGRTAAALS